MSRRPEVQARELVALVLAVGLGVAINCVCFGVLYDAVRSDTPGLSENATQILTTAFGGIIGVLGSFIGYRAGARTDDPPIEPEPRHRDPAESSED